MVTERCFITVAFQLFFRIYHHKVHGDHEGLEFYSTHQLVVYADVNLLGRKAYSVK
jgi:hypothetical protein